MFKPSPFIYINAKNNLCIYIYKEYSSTLSRNKMVEW